MSQPAGQGGARPLALFERVARTIALAGGVLSLCTACVVVLSVLLRWANIGSVPGDFEIVQMATAITVFCSLPLCQLHRGNIMVDTFTNFLPRRVTTAIDAMWDLVYAGLMLILAFSLAQGARDVIRNGTSTMVLGLPLWPAIALASALTLVLALTAVTTARKLMRGRP
ncbi:MAG: TRAP transporter small permease [Beijerinckiaceae bacterium]